jgi:hypothetical protein
MKAASKQPDPILAGRTEHSSLAGRELILAAHLHMFVLNVLVFPHKSAILLYSYSVIIVFLKCVDSEKTFFHVS